MRRHLAALLFGAVFSASSLASAQLWKGKAGDIAALEKAAQSDAATRAEYAWHLLEGQGGKRFDPEQIFKLFESAAAQGSPLGQVGLSRCYAKGIGTKADMRRAWQFAEQAGKVNHPEGWKQMGYLMSMGLGVAKDRQGASKYTAKAVEGGSIAAKLNQMIETGYKGYRDRYSPPAAMAIETGFLLAALNASWGYHFSRGVPEEHATNRRLIALLEDRAKLEHPDALRALAFIRGCQGDNDAKSALLIRAAKTGVLDGVEEVCKDLNLPPDPNQGREIAPFFVSKADLHAISWYCYQQGDRDGVGVTRAAFALGEGYDGKAPDPEASAKLLAKHLPGEKKQFHFFLANRYLQLTAKDRSGDTGKLAVAHITYASDQDPRAFGLLAFMLMGEQTGIAADLPRAHAAMSRAPAKDRYRVAAAKALENKLSPEQKAQGEALAARGYPTAPEFMNEAAAFLKAAGEFEGTYE